MIGTRRLRVLMMPDYRSGNPYQQLLGSALAPAGVEVVFPVGYRRGLPILRAVRDNAPIDLLHLHWTEAYTQGVSWFGCCIYWWKLLADLWLVRQFGVPIVWTLHNLLPHECRWPGVERYFRRRLARGVSQVIVHGRQSRDDAIGVLDCRPDRVTVAPHGHYRDVYPAATAAMRRESRDGLGEGHRIFLFFGFMRPYKGLERLLRVWGRLNAANASLWLVGPCLDAAYESGLRNEAEKTRGVRIECGFVEPEKVSRVFAGADIVVLPFERVQTSGSAILALSFAKPVIAPRLGEVPETLGVATDLLFEPGSDEALSAAIERGLQADLAELTTKSVQACQRLEWEPIGRLTADVYHTATVTEPSA